MLWIIKQTLDHLPCVPVPVSCSMGSELSVSAGPSEQVTVLVLLSSDFSSVSVGATKQGLMVAVPYKWNTAVYSAQALITECKMLQRNKTLY
jgi:hypothetical protein